MLKIAICDDDKYVCTNLQEMIADYKEQKLISLYVDLFYTGEDLVSALKSNKYYDLIFLDIELGTTTGVEVGHIIREALNNHSTKLIFVTSKDGYERSLFDVQPFYFIKKPVKKSELKKCLDLAVRVLKIDNNVFEYIIKNETHTAKLSDILYFERVGRRVSIVTTGQKKKYFYGSLQNIKSKLPKTFIAPNRTILLNYNYVTLISEKKIKMSNKREIDISQRNAKSVRASIIEFERER